MTNNLPPLQAPDTHALAAIAAQAPFSDQQMLSDLCEAYGWQGSTIHQVIAEITRLRAVQESAPLQTVEEIIALLAESLARMEADWHQIDMEWGPSEFDLDSSVARGYEPLIAKVRAAIEVKVAAPVAPAPQAGFLHTVSELMRNIDSYASDYQKYGAKSAKRGDVLNGIGEAMIGRHAAQAQVQPQPDPLTYEQSDLIRQTCGMSIGMLCTMQFVRAVERAHGIGTILSLQAEGRVS